MLLECGKLVGMGLIIPEDFPLSHLRNDAERRVVEAFRDQLNDGWLIVPSLSLWAKDRGDYELDIVLIHQDFGIANIEVKGHKSRRRCRGGTGVVGRAPHNSCRSSRTCQSGGGHVGCSAPRSGAECAGMGRGAAPGVGSTLSLQMISDQP
jgi:hypothetical protein